MTQKIGSREYKVMLKKENFVGSQTEVIKQAENFWQAFKEAIKDIVFDTDGSLDKIEKQRAIRFYDTAKHDLRKSDYVFRERVDINLDTGDKGKREVTLKFRHPDRYVSEDRDMSAADANKGETKFEEDIKLPFISLYSFSTKQPISNSKSLNKLNDPGELYPDLKDKMQSYQENKTIHVVGNFTAIELVIEGADFQIGEDPKVEAECALVVWYENVGKEDKLEIDDKPAVVEFSFKYENEKGEYDGKVAQKAYEVFRKLKEDDSLKKWIDLEGPTKTAYIYSKKKVK